MIPDNEFLGQEANTDFVAFPMPPVVGRYGDKLPPSKLTGPALDPEFRAFGDLQLCIYQDRPCHRAGRLVQSATLVAGGVYNSRCAE